MSTSHVVCVYCGLKIDWQCKHTIICSYCSFFCVLRRFDGKARFLLLPFHSLVLLSINGGFFFKSSFWCVFKKALLLKTSKNYHED